MTASVPIWFDDLAVGKVGAAMAARFVENPEAPPKPVEKQIYGAFYSNADKQLLLEFQRADWPRRQEIVASLADPRLRQLGRRLVALHSPALLNAEETTRFNACLREKRTADDVPETEWMTVAKARAAIDALLLQDAALPAELNSITDFIER